MHLKISLWFLVAWSSALAGAQSHPEKTALVFGGTVNQALAPPCWQTEIWCPVAWRVCLRGLLSHFKKNGFGSEFRGAEILRHEAEFWRGLCHVSKNRLGKEFCGDRDTMSPPLNRGNSGQKWRGPFYVLKKCSRGPNSMLLCATALRFQSSCLLVKGRYLGPPEYWVKGFNRGTTTAPC